MLAVTSQRQLHKEETHTSSTVLSGFRLPPRAWLLQTTKFLPPYATELPTSPSRATLRAHLSRFPSCSRWGPQKRGLLGLAALPFSAGGGRKRAAWRHGLQFPGPRLTPEVGKQPGSQLGAAGRASFQAATQRKPFVHLTWKADHSRWGRGSSGKTLCVEVPFGCSGAGRSCPFSTRCSAASPNTNKAPPATAPRSLSGGWAPLGPCIPGPQNPATE